MKKEWKSNNYNNVRQIVEAHTHMSAEEFLYPQKDPYLHGLKEAVQFVKEVCSLNIAEQDWLIVLQKHFLRKNIPS